MLSPSSTSLPPLSPAVPRLKLKSIPHPLNLGDSMKIIGLHENGYMAQINGNIEVLLVHGFESPPIPTTSPRLQPRRSVTSIQPIPNFHLIPSPITRSAPTGDESPPSASRLHSSRGFYRSKSHPAPSRCLDGLNLEHLRLSPVVGSISPPLSMTTTLFPRPRKGRERGEVTMTTPHKSPRSTPTSPRISLSPTQTLSPPTPSIPRSPPRQRTSILQGSKQFVQRSPSYNYYPVQGWVLWRRSIGQWERVWLASKKSPTRLCFFTTEGEDSEEREAVRVEDMRSIWAPREEEESAKMKHSDSVHFRLFTDKKTIYLIVSTSEKMRYWVASLRKLNPDMEIDVTGPVNPASPLSPRPFYLGLSDDHYATDDELEWD